MQQFIKHGKEQSTNSQNMAQDNPPIYKKW